MKKIAIVGSGISGLVAAYLLAPHYEVILLEANSYLGGHTLTHKLQNGADEIAVDMGFIVFNDRTYPKFTALLEQLAVAYTKSTMSFSVSCADTGWEFKGNSLNTLFAQRKNLVNPRFYRLLVEITRFTLWAKKQAAALETNKISLRSLKNTKQFSSDFFHYYLIPMISAIWSADRMLVETMDVNFLLSFFHNHGLLNFFDRPQWYSLVNGSHSYIPKLTQNVTIHCNCQVATIRRDLTGVSISTSKGDCLTTDAVIIATHSDQALSLLAEPTTAEQAILSAISYQKNEVLLHSDATLMPTTNRAWASWNYYVAKEVVGPPTVTYWMNELQRLPSSAPPLFVSLNPQKTVNEQTIHRREYLFHPLFTEQSLRAQQRFAEINDQQHTYYCGAYWGNGFHEDGVESALRACQPLLELSSLLS